MVRCSLCLTPCADSDAIVADGQTFHKDCFKCLRCQRQLALDHYQLISLGPVCPDGTCSAQKSSSQKPSSSSTSTPTSAKPRNRVPVWSEEFDEEGDPYYFNHVTGDSLWERPDDFDTAEMIESDEESDYGSDNDEYKEASNGVAASPRKSDADRQRARDELLQQEREAAEQAARIKRQAMERDSRRREAERKARDREEAVRLEEAEHQRLEEAEEEERRRRRELAAQRNKQAQDEDGRRQSEAARQREKEEARLKKEKQKKRDAARKEDQKKREAAREDRDKKRANLEKLFSSEVNKKKSLLENNNKQGIASSWEIEKQRQQEFKRKLGKSGSSKDSFDVSKVKTRRKAPSSPPQPKPVVSTTLAGGSGRMGAGSGDSPSDDLAALFARLGIGDKHLERFIAEEMAVGDVLLLSPQELEDLLPTKGPRVRLSKFIADQRLKDQLAFLIRGEYFKKIVTFGTSRRRLIMLNESLTSLIWAENPNRIKGALERLTLIVPGDPTSKSGALQFTATGTTHGKKRSLLLQADNVETQQKWVRGLQKALDLNANR